MAKDQLNLNPDEPVSITVEQIREITGNKEISTHDDFKSFWDERETPDKVTEKVPYEFKDDFIKGAVEYYDKKGEIAAYAKNNVDYSKAEAKDLIRMEVKRANEGLSDSAINHLTAKEMEKYSLGEDASDDDKSLQEELLTVRAGKVRDTLTEEQKLFNAPEKPSVDIEKWASDVNSNEVTKGVLEGKIEFKHGETSFNLDLESPKDLVDMTIDNTSFTNLFVNKDGGTDFSKWYKVLAYAQNPDVFEDSLIKHGQSIGSESVVNELKNHDSNVKTGKSPEGETLMEAFANRGKVVKR